MLIEVEPGREVVEKRGCVGHTYPAESCVGQLE